MFHLAVLQRSKGPPAGPEADLKVQPPLPDRLLLVWARFLPRQRAPCSAISLGSYFANVDQSAGLRRRHGLVVAIPAVRC